MATNKNRINAYVGDGEYSSFTAFCEQWQCSQSKGVELMIRHFLMGESNVNSNVTDVSTDELNKLRERLGKLESNVTGNVNEGDVMNSVGYVTLDEVERAIATSLNPIIDKLAYLSLRITDIQSELGGITATETLAKNQPVNEFYHQNDVLPSEEKTEAIEGNLGGKSNEVTDKNTEGGLLGKELAVKIGLLRKDGQPASDILTKWIKLREEGQTSLKGKNSAVYAEFMEWEKIGDRWFPIV